MHLLIQLGVNETLAIQFATFLVVFLVLKTLLFGPYFAAYVERKERTLGKTELAERYIAEAQVLEDKYNKEARDANDRYRDVYDKSRSEALKEYDQEVNNARNKSKDLIEQSRVKIAAELQKARTQLEAELPAVAQLINQKLIGKDLPA